MLQYPSIPGFDSKQLKAHDNADVIAFYKYDGSNLRWEWSPKQGWHKFGTRKQLFDQSSPLFNQAIPIFMDTMASDIERRVMQAFGRKVERITAFTEFFGPSSFAGQHEHDEAKELKLFDVFIFKKGFIQPKPFLELFGKLPFTAKVVYQGPLTSDFRQQVFNNELDLEEGVIAKGTRNEFSLKLKTLDWYTKLKTRYADDWEARV